MTPQQIEALKLALEALKNYAWHGETCPQHPTYSEPKNYPKCTCGYAKVIPALEEALAEHAMQEVQRLGQEIEQEPVAFDVQKALRRAYHLGQSYWADADSESYAANRRSDKHRQNFDELCEEALAYTAPPQRKPLTNGEIYTAYITATNQTLRATDERLALAFARAIEAAHGIKGDA